MKTLCFALLAFTWSCHTPRSGNSTLELSVWRKDAYTFECTLKNPTEFPWVVVAYKPGDPFVYVETWNGDEWVPPRLSSLFGLDPVYFEPNAEWNFVVVTGPGEIRLRIDAAPVFHRHNIWHEINGQHLGEPMLQKRRAVRVIGIPTGRL
jgi:hypothetical protein